MGYPTTVDLKTLLLAPILIPVRTVRLLDDVNALAERARRDPDPVEEVRWRLDALLAELAEVIDVARDVTVVGRDVHIVAEAIVDGGAELTATAKVIDQTMLRMLHTARVLERTAEQLDSTGTAIHDGGEDLNGTAMQLHVDTRELIDGGSRLTEVSEQLEEHMRVFRAAVPRLLEGLDMVEQLEGAVETVADTVEPLQGAAERVGRVTQRLSRSR